MLFADKDLLQGLQPAGSLRTDGVLEDLGPRVDGRGTAGAAGGSVSAEYVVVFGFVSGRMMLIWGLQ